jgi:hypothetical protein
MLLMDFPPMLHRMLRRHRVIRRSRVEPRPLRIITGAIPQLPLVHHECLTCGKRWVLEELS